MADGQIVFEIKGDNKSLKQTLSQTTNDIKRESSKWETSVDDSSDKISSSLTGAFGKVVASAAFVKITSMLIDLGIESVNLASDLEEVQNVVDVTFGPQGAARVETWAKAAGESFGLTELQAKKYTSTIGAMLKSSGMADDGIVEMSTSLAGLTADMASFYNLDFDEAFQKIRAGMAGEVEPLRQLGINMSVANMEAFAMANGFEQSFDKMSQGEQTMLRYKYLLNATTDAQGDFARTSDGFANSQRRMATAVDTLKAQLGDALLPIATTITNAMNDLLDVLVYKPPETAFDVAEKSMSDAAAQATEAQGILGYMDSLYERYGEAATKSDEWAAALERLKEVMPDVNQFINDETSELTATNEQLRKYIENRKQALIEEAKSKAVQQLNEEYTQAGVDYYTAEINRDIARETAAEARRSLASYISSHAGHEGFRDTGFLTIEQMSWAAKDVAREFGESESTINEWVRIYNEQNAAATTASNSMAELENKMNSLKAQLEVANQALERLASAAGSAAGSLAVSNASSFISGGYNPATGVTAGKWLGSFASGLRNVPYDGYAYLHQGERILTAAEASLSRQANLYAPSFDYGTMSSAMWDNAPAMGGNVYLDGRVVGQVISDQQGRSYRKLTRSGWQG